MNNLQQHRIEYLSSQLDEDDMGLDICLQHLSGQELLKKKRIFERPSHANTKRVYFNALLGSLIVTFTAITTSTIVPSVLITIPLYIGYVALVLGIRQIRLA